MNSLITELNPTLKANHKPSLGKEYQMGRNRDENEERGKITDLSKGANINQPANTRVPYVSRHRKLHDHVLGGQKLYDHARSFQIH